MSRSVAERNFPDVRDIFSSSKCKDTSSHRRGKDSKKKSVQNIIEDSYEKLKNTSKGRNTGNGTSPSDEVSRKNHKNSTKTITERDLKHLERRLSMKKTIRKQISRNLAQAFIDDPNIANDEEPPPTNNNMKTETRSEKNTRCLTINQSKISKCEPNVLEMLKDCEQPKIDNRSVHYIDENEQSANPKKKQNGGKSENSKRPFWKFLSPWNKK